MQIAIQKQVTTVFSKVIQKNKKININFYYCKNTRDIVQ